MNAEEHFFGLPRVRRLEAVGFRSWPAASTTFDGTWAIRLTAGHPSKRLNSVNPLDPGDQSDLEGRIGRVARRFRSFGRPLIFRQSPLAPPKLNQIFNREDWRRFDETRVMLANLHSIDLRSAVNQVPLQDVGRWIDHCVAMDSFSVSVKPGLSELIGLVTGDVGLFLSEDENRVPQAAAMAVRFGDLLGLFEVVSNPVLRGRGFARQILRNAILWGRERGARQVWLQVVSENTPAIGLYQSEGFSEVYRYAYRQASAEYLG